MTAERRRRRSDVPFDALRLFLEALAARLESRTIVVADDDGLLLSGVGDGDLEALAAIGPAAEPRARVHERVLDFACGPMRLLQVGGRAPPIDEARDAIGRILAVS